MARITFVVASVALVAFVGYGLFGALKHIASEHNKAVERALQVSQEESGTALTIRIAHPVKGGKTHI